MKFNEIVEPPVRCAKQKAIDDLYMMSTTTRYPIKPKTLTLLELCQSINELRRPVQSIVPSHYQSTPNVAQVLTRRLYLHPLAVNPNGKPQLSKLSPDIEQRHQSFSEKSRDRRHLKKKLSHRGLAILSTSLPLTTRSNPRSDIRHSRDKMSIHTDDDTISDNDANTVIGSWNQSNSFPAVTRGTLSSTHTLRTRPSCAINHPKMYTKPNRSEKNNLWHSLGRTSHRSIPLSPPTTPRYPQTAPPDPLTTPLFLRTASPDPPMTPLYPRTPSPNPPTTPFYPRRALPDPPTTPLDPLPVPRDNDADFDSEDDEPEDQYFNYNFIQKIQIYKRNPVQESFNNEDNEYDDYIYGLK